MRYVVSRRILALALVAAGLLAGCSRRLDSVSPAGNLPPTVTITSSVAADAGARALSWRGDDPDGRVDHYVVSVLDLAAGTRSSSRLSATGSRLPGSREPGSMRLRRAQAAPAPTIFSVRAVDDRGAVSQPDHRAFFEDVPAPVVRITFPRPSAVIVPATPTAFTIEWEGTAGAPGTRLTSYRYLLIPSGQLPVHRDAVLANPDTLRALYAPGFEGWTEVRANQTSVEVSGLIPMTEYLFAITVFDENGAYDPVFDLSKNVLRFFVSLYPRAPRLEIRTPYASVLRPFSMFIADTAQATRIEIPSGSSFNASWIAIPPQGSTAETRWAIDPPRLDMDSTTANDPVAGWSRWGTGSGTITVGPFERHDAGRDHFLFVQARDRFGLQSQEIFRIHPVVLDPASRPLLIVDDTRHSTDRFSGGTWIPPVGGWPTAAELDTFLYARGGVPWRLYPPGSLSAPGVFAGYEFDTLGTRDAAAWGELTLEKLSRYRAIIWMVDASSAAYTSPPTDPRTPISFLRYHSQLGMTNPLQGYVANGGRLWLLGGGVATAAMAPWNRGTPSQFTSPEVDPSQGELQPGMLMTDAVGWRSLIQLAAGSAPQRLTTASEVREGSVPSPAFPALLQRKTTATDPLPPLRSGSDFYGAPTFLEELAAPNEVTARFEGRGRDHTTVSVLDSIYYRRLAGDPAGQIRPAMTRMHPPGGGTVLFSGFDIWHWRRQDCVALVDAVLQGEWGLVRATGAIAARRAE